MKKITFLLTLAITAVGATTFAPQQADAACYIDGNTQYCTTYNVNSNNRYKNTNPNRYYNNSHNFQIAQLQAYVDQLQALIDQLRKLQENEGSYPTYPRPGSRDSKVDVTTRSATDIEDNAVTLRGEVDFNNEDEATVYFQYGRSSSNLKYQTTHWVLDEDDDDEDFEQGLTDLKEDTKYYFRAVAEDERGREDYGRIYSFTTDDDNDSDDDYPEVEVEEADDIDENSAKLEGEIDMNDFKNGIAFFVYGEDEDQVNDIEKDYDTYTDVDEDGDDLQKIKVDSDVDNKITAYATIGGLDDDTDIYYTLCVEFEDEDDDDKLICASTEEFTTDED